MYTVVEENLTIVEVIFFKTMKDKLKLLRMNRNHITKSYEGYMTVTREVKENYDDRQRGRKHD